MIKHRFIICLQNQTTKLFYTDTGKFSDVEWEAKTYCSRGIHTALHGLQFNKEVKRFRKNGFELRKIDRSQNPSQQSETPKSDCLANEPITMNYLDFGTPISFGYTAQYLPQKNVTRRDWKESHANKFVRAYVRAAFDGAELRVPAIDKGYHAGGKQIGWLTLLEIPYKEKLRDMSEADLIAEGGMCATVSEFVSKYFKGDSDKEVWVVKFKFQGIETESHVPEPVTAPDASRRRKNRPTNTLEIPSEIIPFFNPEPEIQSANHNLKILTSSKSDEHYTPENIINAAREVMGEIDLDPMSSEAANQTVRATRFYNKKDDDGLTKPWTGRVWLNPAFSLANEAVSKLIQSHLAHEVTEALLLLKAAPDTARHQLLAPLPFCEWRGRIKFVADSNSQVAPFAVLIFYLGNNFPKFREVFGRFGNIRIGQKQVDELESDRRDLLAKVAQLQLQLAKKSEVGEADPRIDWLEDDICDRIFDTESRLKGFDIDRDIPQFEILSRQRIQETARLEELKSLQKRIGFINNNFFGDRAIEQPARPKLEEMEGWRSEFAIGKLVQAGDLTVEIRRYLRIKDEWICIARIRGKGESYSEIGQEFHLRISELLQDFTPYKFSEDSPSYRLGSVRSAKELKSMFPGVKFPTVISAYSTEMTMRDNSIWQAFKEKNTERCAIKWRCEVLPTGDSRIPRIAQKNDRLEAVTSSNLSY